VLQLEAKIKEKISDNFKEGVSFQSEVDLFVGLVQVPLFCCSLQISVPESYFSSVVSSAIIVQLRELEAALDPAFDSMSKSTWATIENVSGPSPYVSELVRGLDNVVSVINPLVEQKKYLRNFYDKAAA
jgi:vacuolar protein sorting-associated protein 53